MDLHKKDTFFFPISIGVLGGVTFWLEFTGLNAAMDLRMGSRPWMYPSHPMASQELRRDISVTSPPMDIRRIWKLREAQNCPVPSGLSVSWLFGVFEGRVLFFFKSRKQREDDDSWKQPTPPFEDENGFEFPACHVTFQGRIFFCLVVRKKGIQVIYLFGGWNMWRLQRMSPFFLLISAVMV